MLLKVQAGFLSLSHWCRASEKHLLIALALAVFSGSLLFVGLYFNAVSQNEAYQQRLISLQMLQDQTLRNLARADVDATVNRNADYTLRKTLAQQQKTLNEQKRLLEFYSLLMAQGKTKDGLELNGSTLTLQSKQDDEVHVYAYQFVFVQYAKHHSVLKADITIKLLGTLAGESTLLDLSELHKPGKNVAKNAKPFGKLKFKYFQKMQGLLTLPVGFIPEQIVITAIIKKKKAKPWQRIVDWQTEE